LSLLIYILGEDGTTHLLPALRPWPAQQSENRYFKMNPNVFNKYKLRVCAILLGNSNVLTDNKLIYELVQQEDLN
jgi:hypothetical protein